MTKASGVLMGYKAQVGVKRTVVSLQSIPLSTLHSVRPLPEPIHPPQRKRNPCPSTSNTLKATNKTTGTQRSPRPDEGTAATMGAAHAEHRHSWGPRPASHHSSEKTQQCLHRQGQQAHRCLAATTKKRHPHYGTPFLTDRVSDVYAPFLAT